MRAGGFLCGVAIMAALGAGASEDEVKVGSETKTFKDWAKAQKLGLGGDARQGPEAYFVAEVSGAKAGEWLPAKAWEKAKALKFVFLDGSGDKPQAPTEAKVLTCGGVLHFRFECQDPDAKHLAYSSTGRDSNDLWRDDCIEIRLRPDGAKSEKGPHFILNPAGALYDADANEDVSWDPPARRRARIHQKGWTVELSVPLRAFAAEGDMPIAWPANFVRCRQGREDALAEETAWRSTGALEGKNPAFFGWLYLEAVERKLPAPAAETFNLKGSDLLANLGKAESVVRVLEEQYFSPAAVVGVAEKPPALNGTLADPAWQQAPALALEPLNEAIHPAEIEGATARVLLGDGRLYIGVRCAERDVKSIVAQDRPDGKDVFRDDSVEIFLAPGRKESADYRQIVVNPRGSFYSGRGKKPASREGIVVKTKTGANEWTAEIEVPFENLGLKAGEVPALWGFNVVRNRAPRSGEPEQASAWSLPYSWTVHNPARFGSLWLAKADVFADFSSRPDKPGQIPDDPNSIRGPQVKLPDAVVRSNWDVFGAEEREKLELRTMTDRFMRKILDEQYAVRDKELAGVKTWDDWLKIRDRIRKAFADSVGGFPAERTELRPRVEKAFEDDEIRIEKIIYESRPKFYVTANLYLPKRSGGKKVPAIVRVVGHSTRGRLSGYVVTFSEHLARLGYAVLAIDNLGQGERIYINGGHGSRTPTTNHYFQGAALTLTGFNLAGHMIWDVMRGIDYLETRPEIDMSRVVMTGESGGGTLTSYVAVLEDRLLGAAPVSAVGTNRMGGGNYDSEQVLYGTSRDGLDGEGRTAAFAPKPITVISEVGSDESLEANKAAFEVSRKAFNLKDAGAKLEYVPTKGPHGYGPPHQRPFLEWIQRTMPPNAGYPAPADKKAGYSVNDLYASKSWRAFYSRELADRETVWSLNTKRIARELGYDKGAGNQKEAEARAAEIRKKLRELLVLEGGSFDPVKVTEHGRETVEGIIAEKLVIETEPGVFVPAVYLWDEKVKAKGKRPAILWLLGRGKRSLLKGRWKELAENLKAGASILVPDLRGTGETSPSVDESYLGDETSLNGYGLRIAHPLIGMRVRDALACVAYLRTRGDVMKDRVAIVGDSLAKTNSAEIRQPRIETDAGLEPLYRAESLGPTVALLAFVLDEKIHAAHTRGGLASYASICERPYFYHPFAAFVPGILQHFDVADLYAACAPRHLYLEDPVNGRNQIVAKPELEKTFANAVKTYGLWKKPAQLWIGKCLAQCGETPVVGTLYKVDLEVLPPTK